jgi:hypothetical protein
MEPINGELRHGLAQHRVDIARAQCKARRFNGEGEQEALDDNNDELCGAKCFSTYIVPRLCQRESKSAKAFPSLTGSRTRGFGLTIS